MDFKASLVDSETGTYVFDNAMYILIEAVAILSVSLFLSLSVSLSLPISVCIYVSLFLSHHQKSLSKLNYIGVTKLNV